MRYEIAFILITAALYVLHWNLHHQLDIRVIMGLLFSSLTLVYTVELIIVLLRNKQKKRFGVLGDFYNRLFLASCVVFVYAAYMVLGFLFPDLLPEITFGV